VALAYIGKARDGIVTQVLNFGAQNQINVRTLQEKISVRSGTRSRRS
jgi:hypothetical protein